MLVDKEYDERLERVLGACVHEDYTPPNTTVETLFGFSNEDLRHVFSCMKIKGGRVATVGSSGDQALNAIYYGAKDVTIIDGNMLTEPFVDLKLATIKNLDYNEFNENWCPKAIKSGSFYSKVSHDLSENSKMFWDMCYLEGGGSFLDFFLNTFTFNQSDNIGRAVLSTGCEFYDDATKYNILKEKLQDVSMHYEYAYLPEFPSRLKGRYDAILLSNINDYNSIIEVVKDLAKNNLKKGGKIQLHYTLTTSTPYSEFKRHLFGKKIKKYDAVDLFSTKTYASNKERDQAVKKGKETNNVKLTEFCMLEK